jgi:drug/metabolite transporter (DMT)-like permease
VEDLAVETLAVVLSILGALALGAMNVLRSHLMKQHMLTEGESRVVPYLIGGATCVVWFLGVGESFNLLTPSEPVPTIFWLALAASIAVNVFIQFATIRSYSLGEASLVAPIQALTPGLIIFAAMVLGEIPSTLGYVGIALIAIGTYVHARGGVELRRYFEPLFVWTLLRPYKTLSQNERALRWAYLSAIFGTVGLLGDATLARYGDVVLGYVIWFFVLGMVFLPWMEVRRQEKLPPLGVRLRKYAVPIVGQGILLGLGQVLFATAFRLAPVSYVGSLKRLAIMVTVMLAVIYLGEKTHASRRIITASIITAGAICLAFDPTQASFTSSFIEFIGGR